MNELKKIKEFEEILQDYKVSDHAQKIIDKIKIIALVAPSSTGRNTVIRELLKNNRHFFIISDTTRKPRINDGVLEQSGVEYWFKSEDEVLGQLKNGEMLEAEIIHKQQVSGISVRELENALKEDKIAITDMDLGGVIEINRIKNDAKIIFMLPPSFDEWIRRLDSRGHMPDSEKQRRFHTAVKILETGLKTDHAIFVVNKDYHETAKIIDSIYDKNPDQQEAREVAVELLDKTKKFLSNNH